MVTKKQCEDLMDRLADKSLTFGCLVLLGEDRRKYRVLNQIGKRGEELGYKTEILGHPIHLHDVIFKIALSYNSRLEGYPKQEDKWNMELKKILNELDHKLFRVMELWMECDIRKSLQSIFEDIDWVIEWEDDFAKSSPATDLFQFLISLNLKN